MRFFLFHGLSLSHGLSLFVSMYSFHSVWFCHFRFVLFGAGSFLLFKRRAWDHLACWVTKDLSSWIDDQTRTASFRDLLVFDVNSRTATTSSCSVKGSLDDPCCPNVLGGLYHYRSHFRHYHHQRRMTAAASGHVGPETAPTPSSISRVPIHLFCLATH